VRLVWDDDVWDDYVWWQSADRRIVTRINKLIKACKADPEHGIGKPERLREDLSGFWSRHITDEHRLVYRVADGDLLIAQCRYHYSA
jgi:toxin YoeB